MMGSGFWVSLKWFMLMAFILVQILFVVADDDKHGCEASRHTLSYLPSPYNNITFSGCTTFWYNFTIRSRLQHSGSKDVLTIVLSGEYTTGWVGIGFSKTGLMVGSSAMVGWVNGRGRAKIKQYYLNGVKASEVIPDKGELPLTNVPAAALFNGKEIYLAFQLKFEQPLSQQSIILAFGKTHPIHNRLCAHDDKTIIKFEFPEEPTPSLPTADMYYQEKVYSIHSMSALFGWGLTLPFGAIIARYLRHKDPLWFYLHAFLQTSGFICGFSVVVSALLLEKAAMGSNNTERLTITIHAFVGFLASVLVIFQILTLFARPNTDSERRKYWNHCHHWFGRFALFFGAVSLVTGAYEIGQVDNLLKIVCLFLLGITFVIVVVLEALLVKRRSEETIQPPPFQTSPI